MAKSLFKACFMCSVDFINKKKGKAGTNLERRLWGDRGVKCVHSCDVYVYLLSTGV